VKNRSILSLSMVLMMSLSTLIISAQEEQKQYQPYVVYEDIVKPSMIMQYEETTKNYMALFAEQQYPYPMNVYSTDDFHYFIVTPLENFTELDSMYSLLDKVASNAGDKWDAVWDKFAGTYHYDRGQIIIYSASLSYVPEEPRLNLEEGNFLYWGYAYVELGKESEFSDIFKEWVDLFKTNNISDGFNTFMGFFGTEQPLYLWMMNGKNPADFWNQNKVNNEILGEEADILWEKTLKVLRKFEYKTGWFRPELSYIPKEE